MVQPDASEGLSSSRFGRFASAHPSVKAGRVKTGDNSAHLIDHNLGSPSGAVSLLGTMPHNPVVQIPVEMAQSYDY
jgi:hypothetical protein